MTIGGPAQIGSRPASPRPTGTAASTPPAGSSSRARTSWCCPSWPCPGTAPTPPGSPPWPNLWDPDGLCPQAEGAGLQANLSQVFIACASQVGAFGDLLMLGSSVLVDPYGSLAGFSS